MIKNIYINTIESFYKLLQVFSNDRVESNSINMNLKKSLSFKPY